MRTIYESAGRSVTLYQPDAAVSAGVIAYLNTYDPAEGEAVWGLLAGRGLDLACITAAHWDTDLSPWPAPRAFAKGADFAGGADDYLRLLIDAIMPETEARLPAKPAWRCLAGYSLAGLFALYALTRTGIFNGVGSMSGSLWYDGFLDHMRTRLPPRTGVKAYLSLGDREADTRNPRLAKVLDSTREAEALLRESGAETLFELNPGGHYADMPARAAKGIIWLADNMT